MPPLIRSLLSSGNRHRRRRRTQSTTTMQRSIHLKLWLIANCFSVLCCPSMRARARSPSSSTASPTAATNKETSDSTAAASTPIVSSAPAEPASGDGAQLSARQRNQLARQARSRTGGGGGGGAKRSRCAGGSSGSGKDGREDGPPAFLGQAAKGGMLDLAANAREALVSLAADLVAQVRRGGGVGSAAERGGEERSLVFGLRRCWFLSCLDRSLLCACL